MTKENMEIIHKIVELHSNKYKIPGYESEDIKQEAYIIALDCFKSWDEEVGPLENYLSKHLFYRMKNFVRDTTLNSSIYKETKKNLLSPLDITKVDDEIEEALIDKHNFIKELEVNEIIKKIDQLLPLSLRRDYLKMKAGVKINRGRATKIRAFVSSLLKELTGDINDDEDN